MVSIVFSSRRPPSSKKPASQPYSTKLWDPKKITDITPLISGYREKYDLYANWGNRKLVLEFKTRLGSITKDFNDAQKYFNEIDAVVCWEVTDTDRSKLGEIGIDVEPLVQSAFAEEDEQQFPNATHIMMLGGTSPVYVIDLKAHLAKVC